MDLGKKIRRYRDRLGLTQAELASKLGLTYSSVSQWESGRAVQRTPVIRQLADLFGTTVSELMGEEAGASAKARRDRDDRKQDLLRQLLDVEGVNVDAISPARAVVDSLDIANRLCTARVHIWRDGDRYDSKIRTVGG